MADKIDFDAIKKEKRPEFKVSFSICPEIILEHKVTGDKVPVSSRIELNVSVSMPNDCDPRLYDDIVQEVLLAQLPLLVEKLKKDPMKNWGQQQGEPNHPFRLPEQTGIVH